MSDEYESEYESEYEYQSDEASEIEEIDSNQYVNLYSKYNGIIDIDKISDIITVKINLLDFFEVNMLTLKLNKNILNTKIILVNNNNEILNIYYDSKNIIERDNDKNNGILNVFWRKLKTVLPIHNVVFTQLLLDKMKEVFVSLNKICIICFDQLNITVAKPTICDKELCKWSLEKYNIGFSLKNEIIHNFNICNLLFNTFKVCLVNVKNEEDMIFLFDFSPDFILENGDYITLSHYLKNKELNIDDPIINNVMKWILANNKSVIIETDNFIDPNLETYIFQSSSINKESKFQKMKKEYGSFYVFSGSPYKNWFSIMKNGLKILSNTSRMSTGAMYGAGIYSSSDLNIAMSYSDNSIVALCEVIDFRKNSKYINYHLDRNIYIIKDESIIITRFLLQINKFKLNKTISSVSLKVPEYEFKQEYSIQAYPPESETCPICLYDFSNENINDYGIAVSGILCKKGHHFHKTCFDTAIDQLSKCPICGVHYTEQTGDQPDGTMTVKYNNSLHLKGYEDVGAIIIEYNIPSGKDYIGTTRTAFLPNNTKGKKVLELLKRAFNNKLIFTIGTSLTSGQSNVITWAGIHHKTSPDGGVQYHGYPDPTYLDRVLDELKHKGIQFGRKRSRSRSRKRNT